ncbi:hypothetical protein [Xylophilus sp. GOD-11R]|uniref:hypothetical protein n=1 Tax=Xylophilus sp. GOD-11R TaxID=3089814 RepID=UPI00298C84D4|nr:hypothetical protein [Xylophilus sp. GOD-11R]WPB56224.1 hypothetical protein R9X41_19075 [Xylophilus sp. GOD-11R]
MVAHLHPAITIRPSPPLSPTMRLPSLATALAVLSAWTQSQGAAHPLPLPPARAGESGRAGATDLPL